MQQNFGKLILHREKPNLTLDLLMAHEDLAHKSNLGQLFMLVQVDSRERGLKAKVKEMFNLFQNEYYSSPVPDIESSLEKTCQDLNLNLSEIFNKQPAWFKKLNLLVGVVDDEKIVLSNIGKFSGYLVRKQKISQILNGEDNEQKTKDIGFSQIVSGDLKEDDAIILANYVLFDYFSLEKINKIVSENSAREAVIKFRELISDNVRIPNIVSLILKTSQEKAVEEENVIEEETEKYLQELYGSHESMQQLDNLQQRTGRTLGSSFASFGKLKKLFNFKFVASLLRFNKKNLKLPVDEFKNKQQNLFSALAKIKPVGKEKNELNIKEKDEDVQSAKDVTTEKKLEKKSRFKLKPVYFLVALIIFFAASLFVVRTVQEQKETEQYHLSLVNDAQAKKEEAEAALIYQDKEKATGLLLEAKQILEKLPEDERWSMVESKKLVEINLLIDKINNVYQRQGEVVVDIDQEIRKIVNDSQGGVFLLDNEGGVYSYSGQELKAIDSEIKFFDVAQLEDGEVVAVSVDNVFYEFSGGEWDELNINLQEDALIEDIASYGQRLYVLDRVHAIYKVSNPTGANPSISVWHQENKEIINNSLQMMIDGNIWLNSNSRVVKMYQGEEEDFLISNLRQELGSDLLVYTENEMDKIYVVDKNNNRLIVINKETGQVEAQFKNEKLGQSSGFVVEENEAWFSWGGSVYSIGLVLE